MFRGIILLSCCILIIKEMLPKIDQIIARRNSNLSPDVIVIDIPYMTDVMTRDETATSCFTNNSTNIGSKGSTHIVIIDARKLLIRPYTGYPPA